MTTDKGEYKLASFLDDQEMSRLYEKFILEFYRKECPEIKASASRINWALDDDWTNSYLFCEKSRKKNRECDIIILRRYLN